MLGALCPIRVKESFKNSAQVAGAARLSYLITVYATPQCVCPTVKT